MKLTSFNIFSICLAFVVSLSTLSYAKNAGWAYYEFIEDPINTRSIGMGSAGTALPENRGFTYYNPALPSLNSKTYLSIDYGRQFADMDRAHIEGALITQNGFIDLGFTSHSTGEFKVADETGVYEGSTQSNQSIVGVLGGGFIKTNYAAAITLTGIQSKIGEYSSYGLCGNAGLTITLIDKKLFAGAAALNIGRNSSYLDKKNLKLDYLPFTVRGGFSWNDTIKSKYAYAAAVDVVYSKNYQSVMVPVGVEFWLFPVLAIRAGKRINFESDLFSLGIGLKLDNISFDASFVPARTGEDTDLKWSSGLTYRIASPKKKPMPIRKNVPADTTNKGATTDTSSSIQKKTDTLPTYKTAVERKIIRKSDAVDSSKPMLDTTKIAPVQDSLVKNPSPDTTVKSKDSLIVVPKSPSLDSTKIVPSVKEPVAPLKTSAPQDTLTVKKAVIEEDGALTPSVSDSVETPKGATQQLPDSSKVPVQSTSPSKP